MTVQLNGLGLLIGILFGAIPTFIYVRGTLISEINELRRVNRMLRQKIK